jgi:NitT/TauT family transport system ATP-binding protein
MVTHNIEEAIFLSDRIIIMSAHPGKIIGDVEINIPRPRDRESEDFNKLYDKIYSMVISSTVTNKEVKPI